ncbi:MAG: hypothetical protein NTV39_03880 [Candidatus Saccharibacteria bacterium]|nr:hypothetical protein [Candidatus Saccharibacteria bacterium]
MVIDNKIKTKKPENPSERLLKDNNNAHHLDSSRGQDPLSNIEKDERAYDESPKKFFTEIQTLIDSGEYQKAIDKLKNAEWFIGDDELGKMQYVTFKLAESLQLFAASGAKDVDTSNEMLEEASRYLDRSDGYKEIKNTHEEEAKKWYGDAKNKYQLAIEDENDDIKKVKMPLLDIAMDSLNKSDEKYATANFNNGGEYMPTPTKKRRSLRLGAKAVMRTFKSSIKSTLNHRS